MNKVAEKVVDICNHFVSNVKDRIEEMTESESELSVFQDSADFFIHSVKAAFSKGKGKAKAKAKAPTKKAKASKAKKVEKPVSKGKEKPAVKVKAKAPAKKTTSLNSSHILSKVAKHFGGVSKMSKELGTSESNLFGILRKNGNVSNALALKIEEATDGKFSYKKLTGKKKAA